MVMQFVGYANSGKTTLIGELISRLQHADPKLRIGVIKHEGGGHGIAIDQPDKDTWKYREKGADFVAITSFSQTAFIEQRPVSLGALVERMRESGADYVFVEGFKQESYPKIVLLRDPRDRELIGQLSNVRAIVSWTPISVDGLPVFAIDDLDRLTAFLLDSQS